MLKVPFLDLRVTDEEERDELLAAVEKVLSHGQILLGPEVDKLESRIAARVGRNHAVGCNSGTDALIIALRALQIGPGDEVIVPALSFIATANAVSLVGATPFADLDDNLNISVESVASLITPATKAVIPIHWAAVLLVRLDRLDTLIEKRRQNARYLNQRLGEYVRVPTELDGQRHVYYTYTIQSHRRDALNRFLAMQEIETKIQHPLLMPQHPIYAGQARGTWQVADQLIKRVLCLPSNEKLSADQLARVADAVIEFHQS